MFWLIPLLVHAVGCNCVCAPRCNFSTYCFWFWTICTCLNEDCFLYFGTRWTVCARFTPSCTRPPLLLENTRGITPAWLHKLSISDSIPTSSLFGTRSTRAARLCRSTSGPWKRRTPTLRSSGKCGRRPRNTRTQLVDAIFVSLRSWQSSGPTKRHRSTKDPSLCRNVAMKIAITCATFHLQYPEACIWPVSAPTWH